MIIQRVFLSHPHKVGEGFFEHMLFALTFSGRLFKASAAAFLHAFVPSMCETTASKAIMDMHAEIAARRALMAKSQGPAVSASEATPQYRGQGAASS
ncbi:MAG TPA: DUF6356 family protein [Nordella sp.]|nr:DUF6356 family protein [Nordella sp.]